MSRDLRPHLSKLRRWLPTRGNVLFTVLLIGLFFGAQAAGALPYRSPATTTPSSSGIPYQGRLADAVGAPLTGTYSMIFRLYSAEAGGEPLWEEQRTGSNGVKVSDGLFNVMLGSLTPLPNSVVTQNNSLWLGITVNTDNEMSPRVQLGTVPYSIFASNVADGSITAAKLAPGAVPPGVPVGTVISWWRPSSSTPLPSGEWMIADGSVVTDKDSPLYNQTLPNLTDKFIMGVAAANIGAAGGANSLDMSHSHAVPSHSHWVYGGVGGIVTGEPGYYDKTREYRYAVNTYSTTWYTAHHHTIDMGTSAWSGNTSTFGSVVDNRPQYFGLVFLVRIR